MKISDIFELSYCINLDERKDRWESCQKEFKKIDFYPERFSAIKHENTPEWCRQSHLAILKKAKEENKNVLIFEDDVEFSDNAGAIIERALNELSVLKWWNMFYLGGNILRPFYQITDHLAKLSHCQSTHAYGVNKEFLDTLIHWIEARPMIIDVLYADGIIPYNNCFITVPMVAIQRASYSDIEKRTMDYSVPIERYNKFLVKKPF